MDKDLTGLFNYCVGRSGDECVEVNIHHAMGNNKRKVPVFPSMPGILTGVFVGDNQRGDGAVIRVNIDDVRIAFRSLQAGLRETVEVV